MHFVAFFAHSDTHLYFASYSLAHIKVDVDENDYPFTFTSLKNKQFVKFDRKVPPFKMILKDILWVA